VRRALVAVSLACLGAALAVACSSSDDAPATPTPDGSVGAVDGGGPGTPPSDGGGGDGATNADAGCDGPCTATNLVLAFGAKTATLTRAQFGYEPPEDGAVQKVHIEAHAGGSPECPTAASPTPDQTLLVIGVPGAVGPFSSADGVRVVLFDFKDSLGMPTPNVNALDVTGKVTSVTPGDAGVVSAEITATFDGGTLSGTLRAERCTTLDNL
jgi:hypothetical protein